MTGIVRILLAVPLEMLVALDILKAELLVVVDSVVVVHDFDVFSQNAKNIVCLKALHVFVLMSSVIGNVLVTIETEACSLLKDEDDSIIPVNQASADENALKLHTELAKSLGCARLELRDISLSRSKSATGNPGKEHGRLVHGCVDSIRE